MRIFEEAEQYLANLTAIPDFLARTALKERIFTEADYTFGGTRGSKLAFRLGPRLTWTPEKWRTLGEIAAGYGLRIETRNVVHLKEGPLRKEVAPIHDIGVENDITVHPSYLRAAELPQERGTRLFGVSAGKGDPPKGEAGHDARR